MAEINDPFKEEFSKNSQQSSQPFNTQLPPVQNVFDTNVMFNSANPVRASGGFGELFKFLPPSGLYSHSELVKTIYEAFKKRIDENQYYRNLKVIPIEQSNKDISSIAFYAIEGDTVFYYPVLLEDTKKPFDPDKYTLEQGNDVYIPIATYTYMNRYSDAIFDALYKDISEKGYATIPPNCELVFDPTGKTPSVAPQGGNRGKFVIRCVSALQPATADVLKQGIDINKHEIYAAIFVEHAFNAIKIMWAIVNKLPTFTTGVFNDSRPSVNVTIDAIVHPTTQLNAKFNITPGSEHITSDGRICFADFTTSLEISEKFVQNQFQQQARLNSGSMSSICLGRGAGFIDIVPMDPSHEDLQKRNRDLAYNPTNPMPLPGFAPAAIITDVEINQPQSLGTNLLSVINTLINAHILVQDNRYLSVYEKSLNKSTKPPLGLLGLIYNPMEPTRGIPSNPCEYTIVSGYDEIAATQAKTKEPVLHLIDFARQFFQDGLVALDYTRGGSMSGLLGIFSNNANINIVTKELDVFTNGKFSNVWNSIKMIKPNAGLNIGTVNIHNGYFTGNGNVYDLRAIDLLMAIKSLVKHDCRNEFGKFVAPLLPANTDPLANARRVKIMQDILVPNCVIDDVITRVYIEPLLLAAVVKTFAECGFLVNVEGLGNYNRMEQQRLAMENFGKIQYGSLLRPRDTFQSSGNSGIYTNTNWVPGQGFNV